MLTSPPPGKKQPFSLFHSKGSVKYYFFKSYHKQTNHKHVVTGVQRDGELSEECASIRLLVAFGQNDETLAATSTDRNVLCQELGRQLHISLRQNGETLAATFIDRNVLCQELGRHLDISLKENGETFAVISIDRNALCQEPGRHLDISLRPPHL